MPVPRRGIQGGLEYVRVAREVYQKERRATGFEVENPTTTSDRILRRSKTRRQMPASTDTDSDYDSDDDEVEVESTLPMPSPTRTPGGQPTSVTLIDSPPSLGALADNDPTETIIVSFQPERPPHQKDGQISQTTEHLLIAAGSIGATIILVMIVLAIYTMRKRGLSISDVIRNSKNTVKRRSGPPTPPLKYGMDRKQTYDDDDDYIYVGKDVPAPRPAATGSRSGSLSTQTPLQPLGRSDSFNLSGLDRKDSGNRSFLLDAPPSRKNSHNRDISATPSSPLLPIQDGRLSASTRNTRSLIGDEEEMLYSDHPQLRGLPAPPTFKQFLSNRPSISQRPGLGGAMMSRFSWTNSNAPQTPHDPSRDTVTQTVAGRDSFMTQRSSVPRFRTIDSWVNQQSTRVDEQRLKQEFRMTQSTTYSGEGDSEEVPTVPTVAPVPKPLTRMNSLPGKDIKHRRHDTNGTVQTAPIFKQHPGTEVRFSIQSAVPSEVLDMGRKNAAL